MPKTNKQFNDNICKTSKLMQHRIAKPAYPKGSYENQYKTHIS